MVRHSLATARIAFLALALALVLGPAIHAWAANTFYGGLSVPSGGSILDTNQPAGLACYTSGHQLVTTPCPSLVQATPSPAESSNVVIAGSWPYSIGTSLTPSFTSVAISGLAGSGTQCLQISNAGVVSGVGAACGSGGSPGISSLAATLPLLTSASTGAATISENVASASQLNNALLQPTAAPSPQPGTFWNQGPIVSSQATAAPSPLPSLCAVPGDGGLLCLNGSTAGVAEISMGTAANAATLDWNISNAESVTWSQSVYAPNFFTTSRRSAKWGIASLGAYNALAVLDNTRFISFHYLPRYGNPSEQHVGFIANDTPAILAGSRHDHFDAQALSTVDAIAIRQLQSRVESLEREVRALEATNKAPR